MNNEHVVDCVVRWAGSRHINAGAPIREDLEVLTLQHYRNIRRAKVSLVWLKRGTYCLFKDIHRDTIERHLNSRFKTLLKNTSLGRIQRTHQHKDILLELVSLWLQRKKLNREEAEEQQEQQQPQHKEKETSDATLKISVKTWKGELILDIDWASQLRQEGI